MEIMRDGSHWGEMHVEEQGKQVVFRAKGAYPQYGEILRVWGMRDGAQPLLIAVAEPAEGGLAVHRSMSKQYLASVGYWPELPERYTAGKQPPAEEPAEIRNAYIRQLMAQTDVRWSREAENIILTCSFKPSNAFPFAFAFSFCTVEHARARLIWDEKRDCPVWTVPEDK